jgi:hypothetical protein
MRRYRIIAAIVIGLALGACATERGYDAEPVVSANDQRETQVPDLSDEESLDEQNCWRVEVWADPAWDTNRSDNRLTMGIACLVEEEGER